MHMKPSELIACDRCLGPIDGGRGTPHGLLCLACEKVMERCVCGFDRDGNRLFDAFCPVVYHVGPVRYIGVKGNGM